MEPGGWGWADGDGVRWCVCGGGEKLGGGGGVDEVGT